MTEKTIEIPIGSESIHISYRFGMSQMDRLELERRAAELQLALEDIQRETEISRARLGRAQQDLLAAIHAADEQAERNAEAKLQQARERLAELQEQTRDKLGEILRIQAEMLCSTVTAWDITEDGKPVPITVEAVLKMPVEVTTRILEEVRRDQGEVLVGRSARG